MFLFFIIKKLTDEKFEGDIIFPVFLLLLFLVLFFIEHVFTKRTLQKLLKEIEKQS
ncbi:hypothetical protein C874_18115 [Elizabethkingia anophelis 502]|nr:hypothetical protein C874_18115 [Elizabethkingia anophelis 502]